MKYQKSAFGFLIDDAVQHNYYYQTGLDSIMTPEDYLIGHEKESIARDVSERAGCEVIVLPIRTARPGEVPAVVAAFATYHPPYIRSRILPTADELAKLKEHLFLDKESKPDWHSLLRCMFKFYISLRFSVFLTCISSLMLPRSFNDTATSCDMCLSFFELDSDAIDLQLAFTRCSKIGPRNMKIPCPKFPPPTNPAI